ncbi:DUF1667 domain-containing protein [Alkalibacter mobilis]|uniref:DUF1667 domain-containing protein n=1 Tax=Alkalibacter mobilis TaxID=2787712 RepID=UPI0038CBFB75
MTCILCPNGCKLKVEVANNEIASLEGARCPRGEKFAYQELNDPHRNIATSVLVKNGDIQLVSVRLTEPIPKDRIFDVMKEIKKVTCTAPIASGQIILSDVAGLGVDVISTKEIMNAVN